MEFQGNPEEEGQDTKPLEGRGRKGEAGKAGAWGQWGHGRNGPPVPDAPGRRQRQGLRKKSGWQVLLCVGKGRGLLGTATAHPRIREPGR